MIILNTRHNTNISVIGYTYFLLSTDLNTGNKRKQRIFVVFETPINTVIYEKSGKCGSIQLREENKEKTLLRGLTDALMPKPRILNEDNESPLSDSLTIMSILLLNFSKYIYSKGKWLYVRILEKIRILNSNILNFYIIVIIHFLFSFSFLINENNTIENKKAYLYSLGIRLPKKGNKEWKTIG